MRSVKQLIMCCVQDIQYSEVSESVDNVLCTGHTVRSVNQLIMCCVQDIQYSEVSESVDNVLCTGYSIQ